MSKPKKMPKNAEPIREGVAVIAESTTMEQMKSLANQIEQRWGIQGSKEPLTVKDLISLTLSRLDKEIRTWVVNAYYGRTGFVFSSFLCCFL